MTDRDRIKLPLARYAELMAHQAFFAEASPHELRDLLSIAPEAFDDATARWPLHLRDDQLEGDGDLVRSFAEGFAAATQALEDAGTTLEQLRARGGSGAIDATAVGALDRGAVLPFAEGEASAPDASSAEPAEELDALSGHTAMMPSILLDRDATLPFAEADALGIEDAVRESLTLEQYASLRCELSLRPDDQSAILIRYGIADHSGYRLLVAAWDQHLAADAAERSKLEQLLEQYSAWLRRRARGGE